MENDELKKARARMVLEAAHEAWTRLAGVRARRRRYARFTYGDQWSDPVMRRNGTVTTERQKAVEDGRTPLTNNLIRRMVKGVIGRYRMNAEEAQRNAGADTDPEVKRWREFNGLDETDARTLEEFLISGMAVHCVAREWRTGGEGVWVDSVSPEMFFVSEVSESSCRDMELVGRLREMSMGEVLMRFGRGEPVRMERLRRLYEAADAASGRMTGLTGAGEVSFFRARKGRCRVIEVWTLECRESLRCHDPLTATLTLRDVGAAGETDAENRRRRREGLSEIAVRREMHTVWRCRMLAPDATVLDEFDSPLRGGAVPFAVKLYPMVDGDVHSLVEDVIDQQKHVNRLISLMDCMMGTAAKGVLLYPVDCKPEGQKWEDICRKWSDPGGVIPYMAYQGHEPHQVVTPVADVGASAMLKTQREMFEDVSGVTDAMMGKAGHGVIGVERYESQVRNGGIAVSDLLKTFEDFVRRRDALIGKCL